MTRYAANTKVSIDATLAEIQRTLRRYKAEGFMYAYEPQRAMLAFSVYGKTVRFELPIPDRKDKKFTHRGWQLRPEGAAQRDYDQEIRQRWRALALAIKAKLEVVESKIQTFEREFLGYVVLPTGQTVGDAILPQLNQVLSGAKPALLLGPRDHVDGEVIK